ncbi:hypothetical protein BDR26DRAFT_860464 [Obelidium mucronatum]|nr:hypothetical protein BDR26DRAFT_860464 [Obelidium mucronatum]
MERFWAMNTSLKLDVSIQSNIVHCISSYGSDALGFYLTRIPVTKFDSFYFDPFTPNSRDWLLTRPSILQEKAFNFICRNPGRWEYESKDVIQVLSYLRPNTSAAAQEISNSCISFNQFLLDPLSTTSLAWFSQQQPNQQQRHCVLALCSQSSKSTDELADMSSTIHTSMKLDPETIELMLMCLQVRDVETSSMLLSFFETPLPHDALVWYASRNASSKLNLIGYLAAGLEYPLLHHIFTLTELKRIFRELFAYLEASMMGVHQLEFRFNTYMTYFENYNLTRELEIMNRETSWFHRVWFASLNATDRLLVIDYVCSDPVADLQVVMDLFTDYFLSFSDLSALAIEKMNGCPKIHAVMADKWIELYVYIFCAVASTLMIGWTGVMALHELKFKNDQHHQQQRKLSPFYIAMFLSSFALLGTDITYAVYWNILLKNFNVLTPKTISAQAACYILTFIFTSLWSQTYLQISYVRSESLIQTVFPKHFTRIKTLFRLSPILIFSPVLFSSLEVLRFTGFLAPTLTWASQAISEATLLGLDVILLMTFLKFVTGLNEAMETDTTRFKMISQFGTVASVLCLFICIVSLGRPLLTTFWPMESFLLHLCTVVMVCLMHLVDLVMLWMKWMLLRRKGSNVVVVGTSEAK